MAILAPPQVSIIVPCYNQERFLTDALESILRQDFIDWECIMVNDGSTDHTETIAIDYCSRDVRFKYIKTANGGLSFARNTGISGAKGDFIQLLDADDLLEQQKLTYALAFYHANEMAPTVIPYSSMRYFEHDAPADLKILGRDDFVAHVEMHGEDSLESQKMVVKARNPFVISAPLYPRTLFLSIGDFDENLTALEDWDFHLRCVSAGYRFHHQYKPGTKTLIRLHNNSMMRNQQLLDENFYRLIIKHQIRTIAPKKKERLIIRMIRNWTPPVILHLAKQLKTYFNLFSQRNNDDERA